MSLKEELEAKLAKEKEEMIKKTISLPLEDAPIIQDEAVEDIETIIEEEIKKIPRDEAVEEKFNDEDLSELEKIIESASIEKIEAFKKEECKGCAELKKALDSVLHPDSVKEQFLSLRESQINTNENVSNARTDIQNGITSEYNHHKSNYEILESIHKHIGKWFFTVLILASFLSFSLGIVASENKEVVYPIADKVIKAWNDIGHTNKALGD